MGSDEITPKDLRLLAKCQECPHQELCGGFFVTDTSRTCDEICHMCRAICCHTEMAQAEVEHVGGLELDTAWAPWQIAWPDFAWVVGGKVPEGVDEQLFVVTLDSLIDAKTMRWPAATDMRTRFRIPDGANLALSWCFLDWLLDWVLLPGNEEIAYDKVAAMNFDFVLAPNWSVYSNYPRIDQLINMKRRFKSMEELQKRGVKVVPDMAAETERDAERVVEWCLKHRPTAIHFNLQTMKSRSGFPRAISRLADLRREVPWARAVISGVGHKRMRLVTEMFGEPITFLNATAWINAEMRQDINKVGYRSLGWKLAKCFDLNRHLLRSHRYGNRWTG